MEISKTEIGNALTSADENHILATANDIYDETQQAYQSEINQSLKEGKQDNLVSGTNIKTINGTSLLGSGDIAIEGGDSTGDVDEGRLVWSENYAPTGTLLDNVMKIGGNNVLAFMPPSAITIEYSTDNGVTWLDYGWNNIYKTILVTPEIGYNGLYLGKSSSSLSSNNRLRITFDFIAANMRFTPSKACIYFSGVNNSDSFYTKLLIEKYNNYNNNVWEELANQKITTGDWGTFRLPTRDWGYKGGNYRARFRCEFYRTADSVNRTVIGNVIIMATKIVTANSYAKNHHLYTFDHQQNATFPAAITAPKLITKNGTANQVVLGNGTLKALSEISPITDADAEILLDNHIHSINVNANGNNVNISVIESSKNGNTWETEEKNIPLPVATQDTAGIISAADKKKIDNINYEDNTLFVGDGTNGTLSIGHESSKASSEMRVQRDRYATIHVTSYSDTTGGSIAVMESQGGKGRMEVNGDQLAKLVLSGAGEVNVTLSKENEDGTSVETIIDAEEGITAPKLATIGGTSEQILLGDGTLITFDELKAKLGLI